jgi:L-aspartate oxidase
MIPISPAAHYMSGGIKTDLDGRTNIPGLFAVGEVAYTGVHGANRLGSNSLLEGLVFSRRASRALETSLRRDSSRASFSLRYDYNRLAKKFDINLEHQELQNTMMEQVGVLRSAEGLNRALDFFQSRRDLLYTRFDSTPALELQNMLTVGRLMATVALIREESRGSHWREDFPYEDDEKWLKHITLSRNEEDIEVEIGK